MKVQNLSPNEKNPRRISAAKLSMLKSALIEFGDLGCIVYNRKTKRLVGGHQRVKTFPVDAQVVIEKKFTKPTKVGTTAEGFVTFHGEKFKYREVAWDEGKEKAANLAANKAAGEFDSKMLGEMLQDLEEFSFDLDLTMFDTDERLQFLASDKIQVTEHERSTKLTPQGQSIVCPHCDAEFTLEKKPRAKTENVKRL